MKYPVLKGTGYPGKRRKISRLGLRSCAGKGAKLVLFLCCQHGDIGVGSHVAMSQPCRWAMSFLV